MVGGGASKLSGFLDAFWWDNCVLCVLRRVRSRGIEAPAPTAGHAGQHRLSWHFFSFPVWPPSSPSSESWDHLSKQLPVPKSTLQGCFSANQRCNISHFGVFQTHVAMPTLPVCCMERALGFVPTRGIWWKQVSPMLSRQIKLCVCFSETLPLLATHLLSRTPRGGFAWTCKTCSLRAGRGGGVGDG